MTFVRGENVTAVSLPTDAPCNWKYKITFSIKGYESLIESRRTHRVEVISCVNTFLIQNITKKSANNAVSFHKKGNRNRKIIFYKRDVIPSVARHFWRKIFKI